MANFIKRFFQQSKLKKIASPNRREYIPLPEAKKVGYIYSKEMDEGITEAIGMLEGRCKKLGISCQGFEIIKEELNWLSIPVSPQAEEFLKKEYDILFDLNISPSYTHKYLLKSCRCGTIVGYCPDREHFYDIYFSKGKDIKEYIEQSLQYLTIIKRQ